MANQRIDQLNAETAPVAADVLPLYSIAASDTKKITIKNLVQQGAALVDNASIPAAKINFTTGGGIDGTQLAVGSVAAAKLDTSTIPSAGGLNISGSNLQLVAPTSPIVRNASTGSLEHAASGVTAGEYTKVTVDAKGHVTLGASLAAADLPVATSSVKGAVLPGTGLSVTGGGVLNHTNTATAGTTSGITFDAQGHISGIVALAGADLPFATSSVRGAMRPGTGLSVDGSGIVNVTAATNAALGGVIVGSDFSVSTGTISLATQAGVTPGTYTKVTLNDKGVATAATVLSAGDIPSLDTAKITTGTIGVDRYGANTITGAKLANYATSKISDAVPTADYISQFFYNPLERTLFMWDGNVYQPIGVTFGQVVFSGTYSAATNLITSVTADGSAIGLAVGAALVSPVAANTAHYVVVDTPGTGTAPAPAVALAPPDMLLSNGASWILLDVSATVTAQLASNVQFTPAGTVASSNVQSAIQELDIEKLALTGGTLTGNLALNTGIAIVFEGATTDNFETTLYVVDPTADRSILLPNVSGTLITTGDTGTVTSAMISDGTIVDADISATAEIAVSKLVDGSARQLLQTDAAGTGVEWASNIDIPGTLDVTSAATFDSTVAVTGALTKSGSNVVTVGDTGTVTSTMILDGTILNADVNASAAIAGTKISPDFGAQNVTTTGNVTINSQGDVRFGDADSSHYVAFQAPASIAANILWTLPNSDAAVAGYALVSNAAGALSWAEAGGGGAKGGGTDKVFFENDQTVTTSYTITANKNAISAGVVSIDASAVVTIPANANWVVV